MKNLKRHLALFMTTAMVVTSLTGISQPENVSAASKAVTVTNQKQLNSALKNKKVTNITIKTSAKKTFTIKKGTYSKKTLTVNASKATINNSGVFKSIAVKDATTFTENAKNNTVKVTDSKLNVKVTSKASLKKLTLAKKNASDTISVDGTLKTLSITAKTTVKLSGKTTKVTAVKVTAAGCKITSANKINLTTSKSANIILSKNAKASTIKSTSKDAVVTITNNTGDKIKVILPDGTEHTTSTDYTIKKENSDKNDSDKNDSDDKKDESKPQSSIPSYRPGYRPSPDTPNTPTQYPNIGNVTINALDGIASYSGKAGTVTVNSSQTIDYTIPEGDYSHIKLVVNTPNATIRNERNFEEITLVSVAPNTWYETASNNSFVVAVQGDQATIHMVVEGIVQGINVTTPVTLTLQGTTTIPLTVADTAAGMDIQTTAPVRLTNNAENVTLELNSALASTMSSVYLRDPALMPTISAVDASAGINVITNDQTQIVTPSQQYDNTQKSTVTGKVSYISGNTIETVSGNCTVKLHPITNDSTQLAAAVKTVTCTNGILEITDVSYGSYVITVEGFNATVSGNSYENMDYIGTVRVLSPTTKILDNTIILGGYELEPAQISGSIKSAITGELLSSTPVEVKLYKGDALVKTPITTTSQDGSYAFEDLPCGVYTLVVLQSGYTTYTQRVVVMSGSDNKEDILLSDHASFGNDYIRFVLTWNNKDLEEDTVPKDLDSHLWTPYGHHIWYGDDIAWIDNPSYNYDADSSSINYNATAWARLDIDDTTYVGPETTSVYNLESGEYHFYIHNFSDRDSETSNRLRTSGGKVQIYINGILQGVCAIDATTLGSDNGCYWDICTYNSITNELKIIDRVSTEIPSTGTISNRTDN